MLQGDTDYSYSPYSPQHLCDKLHGGLYPYKLLVTHVLGIQIDKVYQVNHVYNN